MLFADTALTGIGRRSAGTGEAAPLPPDGVSCLPLRAQLGSPDVGQDKRTKVPLYVWRKTWGGW